MTEVESTLLSKIQKNLKEFKILNLFEAGDGKYYRLLDIKMTDGIYTVRFFVKYYPGRHITEFTDDLDSIFRDKRKYLMLESERNDK